jgi:hypothetical protein
MLLGDVHQQLYEWNAKTLAEEDVQKRLSMLR